MTENRDDRRRRPHVDWDRPDWGGHVTVSDAGDLATEGHDDEGEQ